MIRCVMFDFGNVLVHFETERLFHFLRENQDQVPYARSPEEIFALEAISEFELGHISTVEMFEGVKKALALKVNISDFLFHYTGVMKLDPKMMVLKQVLQENGVKVAVVSNINIYHVSYFKLVYPEAFNGFDFLMLSFEHGFRKPDHRMWEIPAKQLGVLPEECFFVDDYLPNINAFGNWSQHRGTAHHYNVVDSRFCANGWLNIERKRLIFKMASMNMINYAQASKILGLVF